VILTEDSDPVPLHGQLKFQFITSLDPMLIILLYFSHSLTIKVNNEQRTGDSLNNILSDLGLAALDVNSLRVIEGDFSSYFPLTSYKNLKELTIDDDRFVISIPNNGFKDLAYLESVSIPACTRLGDSAFQGCIVLKTVSLIRVTTISKSCFQGCKQLLSITAPNMTTIGENAFYDCYALPEIAFANVLTASRSSFANCQALESVSLPRCVTFGPYAFQGCLSLVNLTLESAKTFETWNSGSGDFAHQFFELARLRSVSLPAATALARRIFQRCPNLMTIDMPLLTTTASEAFQGCTGLTSVTFPLLTTINDGAFLDCNSLTEINFPNVLSVGASAFENCGALESVSLPRCITVGVYAFQRCHSLVGITLESATTFYIGSNGGPYYGHQFFECAKLASVSLPCATSLAVRMFSNCDQLTTIEAPLVVTIENDAFRECASLESVSFPLLTTIKLRGFQGCPKLLSVTAPNLNTIGESAFVSCNSLTEINFPNVLSADDYSFQDCRALATVSLPRCVTLGGYAFQRCVSLEVVELGSLTSLPAVVFGGAPALRILRAPKLSSFVARTFHSTTRFTHLEIGVLSLDLSLFRSPINLKSISLTAATTLPASALAGQSSLTAVSMPEVRRVEASAFAGCTSITSIEFPQLTELVGDSHFSGCGILERISMPSLLTVGSGSANIFKDCVKLAEIELGLPPPSTFNPSVFSNRGTAPAMTLALPPGGISQYDKSTAIQGDQANDGFWCGISLSQYLIKVKVNQNEHTGITIEDAVTASSVLPDAVTSLIVMNGGHTWNDLLSLKTSYPNLVSFSILGAARIEKDTIPASFMLDSPSITSVSIECPVAAVGENAFAGCTVLSSISFPHARSIRDSCFAGTALVSIALPEVTSIIGNNHFSNCALLTSISLPSLLSVDSSDSVAANSPSIATVTLPAAPPLVTSAFNFDSQPNAALSTLSVFMDYDVADGPSRDGRFYSLQLVYSPISILADGVSSSGRTIQHALSVGGLVPTNVRALEVVAGFLFEDNFPLILPQLRSFVVLSDVSVSSIPASAFSGLENLETVDIKGPRSFILCGRAFEGCLSLRSVILTGLTALTGDFHFAECVNLLSVAMPALAIVPKVNQNIFKSCTALTSLTFGSVPPLTFHRNAFPIPSQISLLLPNGDDYLTYDNSVSITGDSTGDSYWCSIYLPINYFKVLINELPFEGSSLYDAIATSMIDPHEIISIEVTEGVLRLSDISDLGTAYTSLISFCTGPRVSIYGDLGTAFTQSSIRSVSMQTLKSISANAFKGCALLTDVSFATATSVDDSAFAGCKFLTSISLPQVSLLLGDSHFENCTRLSSLSLQSLSTVDPSSSSIFAGIESRLTLIFPGSPPQIFHRQTFTGLSVILELPSYGAYHVYDASLLVDADVTGDFRWCGIPLQQLYIDVFVNQISTRTATLESAASSVGVSESAVTSIQVVGGYLRTSELVSLSTRFPALQRFIVSAAVLMEQNEIPANAFLNAASLSIVNFSVTVSIGSSAFEGCSALSEVTFTNVPFVNDRAFFGTHLTSISLPQCRRFIGDSIFQNCAFLTTVSLPSLLELNPQSANIFAGCTALTSISLPSSPPHTFHADTFAACPTASILLPSAQAYVTYDTSVLIVGDVPDDQRWCKLSLPERHFPQLIQFRVNGGAPRTARTLYAGLLQISGPITSLSLDNGTVSPADFIASKGELASLESLEIAAGTIGKLETSLLRGHSTLESLIVHGDLEVEGLALEGLTALRTLQMREVTAFPGSALTNCTALESVDLRSVEVVQAATFAGLASLVNVTLTSALFLGGRVFSGCSSLIQVHLANVLGLFGDSHFHNCTHLVSIVLLHLSSVSLDSANIFAGCTSLSCLTLSTRPPERFHPAVFVNRQSSVPMSIALPSFAAWANYAAQSETVDGQLFWYGVPHPSRDSPPACSMSIPWETLPSMSIPEESAAPTADSSAGPASVPSDQGPVGGPDGTGDGNDGNSPGLIAATVVGFVLFGGTAVAFAGYYFCQRRKSSKVVGDSGV
jgi:hypothetical protein